MEQEVEHSSLVVDNVGLMCCAHDEGDDIVVAELQLDKSNNKVLAELSLFCSSVGAQVPAG